MKTHCLGNYSLRVALASATPQRSRVLLPTISTQSQLHPRLQHHYVRNATRRPRSFPRASSIRLPSQLRAVQLVIPRRQASTTAVTANATSPPPSTADPTPLTWNEFFGLRQRRRYFNVTSSLILSGGSFASGAGFVSQQSPETMQFFGMDPLVGMIAASLGFFGAGWLAGPLVGNTMFRLFYRKSGGMGIKERDFYYRIKKYRIDPSSSSMQNPVPDYYGEKITSVAGYRQWLKDQRAFNKKRQSFL